MGLAPERELPTIRPRMTIERDILEFVQTELADGITSEAIRPDQDLLEDGIIDSVAIGHLIGFVEERFDIQIGPDDLLPENFRSLESLAELVQSKRAELERR